MTLHLDEGARRLLFLPPDDAAVTAMGKVSTWVQSMATRGRRETPSFKLPTNYLVGEALAPRLHPWSTHEVPAPQAIRRSRFPDVCIGLKIKCVSPFEMLRKERARFVLR